MFPDMAAPRSPTYRAAFCRSPSRRKNWHARSARFFPPRLKNKHVTFDFCSCRFAFTARDTICFPAGMPGNILRGALGGVLRKIACVPECPGHAGRDVHECERRMDCAYARIFEPAALRGEPGRSGPSGLFDWPRPFVLRAAHL